VTERQSNKVTNEPEKGAVDSDDDVLVERKTQRHKDKKTDTIIRTYKHANKQTN
jgi:hypothetical protein